MASHGDTELILLLLLLTGIPEEDQELAERFYHRFRDRFRQMEGWDPEIDMLFRHALRHPMRYDPEVRHVLSQRLRSRLREIEAWGPDLDMLLDRALQYRFTYPHGFLDQARQTAIAVVDGFRQSFEKEVTERIVRAEMSVELLAQKHEQVMEVVRGQEQIVRHLGDEIHDYHWLTSVRVDMGSVSMQRFIPVRLFLADPLPEERDLDLLVHSIQRLGETFGFAMAEEFPPESGSWWKRFILKTKDVLTHRELTSRLKKAEKAVESAYLDKPQAEANHHQADAAASVIASLQNTPNACVQVGTLLVVKATDENGYSGVFATTLSVSDIKRLESDRSVLRQPQRVFQWLTANEGTGPTMPPTVR